MRTSGQLLWRTAGFFSLLSFLLLATGFFLALKPQVLAPAKAPSPSQAMKPAAPPVSNGIQKVVALGDSLTRGAGDANGQGYAGLVRQELEKKFKHPISFTNLAINGQESPDLLKQIGQEQVKTLLAEADLILFTIGGNDLFKQSGGLYMMEKEKLAAATKELTANYQDILRQIRVSNPKAPIIYTSLYNPFGNTEAAAETIMPVLDWNSAAGQISADFSRVFVVPTYDLFQNKESEYLFTDHFHPNAAGYARIAERVMQALE